MKGYRNIFEGRITRDYRFFFLIETQAYMLLRCGKHDEYLKQTGRGLGGGGGPLTKKSPGLPQINMAGPEARHTI